jgi:hypothetical protein
MNPLSPRLPSFRPLFELVPNDPSLAATQTLIDWLIPLSRELLAATPPPPAMKNQSEETL